MKSEESEFARVGGASSMARLTPFFRWLAFACAMLLII